MSARALVKRGLRRTLSLAGRHRWPASRPTLTVLCYHRVLPQGHPDTAWLQPGMQLRPETLAAQLRWLREAGFTPVDLDDWLLRAQQGESLPERAVALTFDDGWADGYEHALPVLVDADAPATIFLVTRYIDTPRSFWPERLARTLLDADDPAHARLLDTLRGDGLSPPSPPRWERAAIDGYTETLKSQRSDQQIDALLDAAMVGPGGAGARRPDLLSWAQVQAMEDTGLIRFGSHTRRHRRVTHLRDAGARREELAESCADLQSRLKRPSAVFCYPNGDTDAAAEPLIRAHYRAACTLQYGWNTASTPPYALRRIPLHEDVSADRDAFYARLNLPV